jgi:hypothetical protein
LHAPFGPNCAAELSEPHQNTLTALTHWDLTNIFCLSYYGFNEREAELSEPHQNTLTALTHWDLTNIFCLSYYGFNEREAELSEPHQNTLTALTVLGINEHTTRCLLWF